jgi:hypothetical protein
MRRYPQRRSRAGVALIEVLLVGTLSAMLIGAICQMYLTGQKLTKRVQAEATVWQVANLGMERIAAITAQGVSAQVEAVDQLRVILPLDKGAGGNYEPRLVTGDLTYRDGESVRFYRANSGGTQTGNILWLSRKPVSGSWTPDAEWSLTPGTTQGRVQPVTSLAFTAVADNAVTATITVTQSYGLKSATVTLTRTIYLRNHN